MRQTPEKLKAGRMRAKTERDADKASFSPEIIALQGKETLLEKVYTKAIRDKNPALARKSKERYEKVVEQLQNRIKPLVSRRGAYE